MPPPQTATELLDWLVRHQILSDSRGATVRTLAAQAADPMAFAKELLKRDWLTAYQVNQILQGHGDALVLGPYQLRERLGEGAMGQVFKAWNPKLARVVAVKQIHKQHLASRKAMERFRREMETASHLDHRNIVLVRDAGEENSRPYIVMDYVEGTDLSAMVKQGGPLPVARAVEYIRQAAEGLYHAHERRVIHRDIKPGNLLVARDGTVKILDFGLARFDTEDGDAGRLTAFGSVLGTVDYIAPEQAENAQAADHRSDIYSLGCTLFFVLTAKPPFPGATMVERVSARMIGKPPSVRKLRPEVPPEVEWVILNMMARDPNDRYQSAQDVADALRPLCGGAAQVSAPLAQPVGPAAYVPAASGVPLAQPVAAPFASPVSEPSKDPFAFSMSDSDDEDNSLPAPGPDSPAAAPLSASGAPSNIFQDPRVLYGAAAGAGVLVLLLLFLLMKGCGGGSSGKKGYPPDASLSISLKPPTTLSFKPGEQKLIIFNVKRTKFDGPVDVSLKGVPDGVRAEPVTLEKDKTQAALKVMASFGIPNMQREVKVHAVAENLSAEQTVTIIVANTDPPPPKEDDFGKDDR